MKMIFSFILFQRPSDSATDPARKPADLSAGSVKSESSPAAVQPPVLLALPIHQDPHLADLLSVLQALCEAGPPMDQQITVVRRYFQGSGARGKIQQHPAFMFPVAAERILCTAQ